MRVLLDECVDWRLAREIVGHDVKTARQMGWTAIKNGELLTLGAEQPRGAKMTQSGGKPGRDFAAH